MFKFFLPRTCIHTITVSKLLLHFLLWYGWPGSRKFTPDTPRKSSKRGIWNPSSWCSVYPPARRCIIQLSRVPLIAKTNLYLTYCTIEKFRPGFEKRLCRFFKSKNLGACNAFFHIETGRSTKKAFGSRKSLFQPQGWIPLTYPRAYGTVLSWNIRHNEIFSEVGSLLGKKPRRKLVGIIPFCLSFTKFSLCRIFRYALRYVNIKCNQMKVISKSLVAKKTFLQ